MAICGLPADLHAVSHSHPSAASLSFYPQIPPVSFSSPHPHIPVELSSRNPDTELLLLVEASSLCLEQLIVSNVQSVSSYFPASYTHILVPVCSISLSLSLKSNNCQLNIIPMCYSINVEPIWQSNNPPCF